MGSGGVYSTRPGGEQAGDKKNNAMITEHQQHIIDSFAHEQPPKQKRQSPRFSAGNDPFWSQCFWRFFNELSARRETRDPQDAVLVLSEDLPWETDSDYAKIIRIAARLADVCIQEKLERLP